MKKICLLLVIVLILSLAACGTPAGDSSTATTEAATTAASTLTVTGLSCPESGTIDAFQVEGTVTSNYELVKVECVGTVTSYALDITVGAEDADPYLFANGIYSADLTDLTDYFVEQYRTLYELYQNAAESIGADDSVTATLTLTCVDASGKSENAKLVYTISGEAVSAPGISGLDYAKSGTTESFWITGTINSAEPLVRMECKGTVSSDALNITVGDDGAEHLYFEDGVTSVDMSMLTDYLISRMDDLYNLYSESVNLLGVENTACAELACTCYDLVGNTVNFTVIYEIIAE